jgi:hypothetical protein
MRSCIASIALLAVAHIAIGDAKSDFDELFGQEVRRVSASRSSADAVALAKQMVKIADTLSENEELKLLLYTKAAAYGEKHAAGRDTAVEALEKLIDATGDKSGAWSGKLLTLYGRRYLAVRGKGKAAAGKEYIEQMLAIADRQVKSGQAAAALSTYRKAGAVATSLRSPRKAEILGMLQSVAKTQRMIYNTRAALRKNPDDTTLAIQLIGLCMVGYADPAKVPELTELAREDEGTARDLALAAKNSADLAPEATLELGDWYAYLADKAHRSVKDRLLLKAQTCYEKFLKLKPKKDLQSLKAKVKLARVDKELDKLMGTKRFSKGWNLVAEFKPTKNPNGAWSYGWAPKGAIGSFKRYSEFSRSSTSGVPVMSTPGKSSLVLNTGKVVEHGVAPGELSLHGSEKGDLAIVRWTAPINGTVKVTGAFGAGNSGTVDAYVVKVGPAAPSALFRKAATATREPFQLTVRVRKGDKIDFILGTAGSWNSDSTPLSVIIIPKHF